MLRQRRMRRLRSQGERESHRDFGHSMASRIARGARRSRLVGEVLGKGQHSRQPPEKTLRGEDVLFRYALCFFLNRALASPTLVARLILRFLAMVSSA